VSDHDNHIHRDICLYIHAYATKRVTERERETESVCTSERADGRDGHRTAPHRIIDCTGLDSTSGKGFCAVYPNLPTCLPACLPPKVFRLGASTLAAHTALHCTGVRATHSLLTVQLPTYLCLPACLGAVGSVATGDCVGFLTCLPV